MEKVLLQFPVKIKDSEGKEIEINSLELNRIKLKVLKDLPPGSLEKDGTTAYSAIIPLIAASAQVTQEIVEAIDFVDLERVSEALEPFLPKSPQTGRK
jgi:hypothetical protein